MRLGVTPVLIPNTMVKPWTAESTALETKWEGRWPLEFNGGVAQLGEHLPCKQGVMSSNLTISIGFEKNQMNLENRIPRNTNISSIQDIRVKSYL